MRMRLWFGMAVEAMPIRSKASRSCQSAVGQTPTRLGTCSAVVDPDLQPHARRARAQPEQVVADREPLRLRLGQALVALRRQARSGRGRRRADVAGDAVRAPAEVVGGGDVGEEVEAELVTQVQRRVHQARRVDDDASSRRARSRISTSPGTRL